MTTALQHRQLLVFFVDVDLVATSSRRFQTWVFNSAVEERDGPVFGTVSELSCAAPRFEIQLFRNPATEPVLVSHLIPSYTSS